ncbi:MAG: PspC domain-containing protein [Bacteroidetes bacterium]|nr:PspC domain-containing protein [Bacteroidota bacterium]
MNKTVTINISGIIFHIEEDAYDSLSKYLATIKGYFSNTDGGNEIMSDIEARIAELLQEKINAVKQVVLMADVDHVKSVMGKPEEFGGEQTKTENKTQNDQTNDTDEKAKRRLFRNPDDKALGGVCSGLAAYFDVDTVWIRLAMFLLIFFGGLSLWVYIILWIIIPEAKTTADKFAMRGESANVNNIFKSFKEEAEDVRNRFRNNSYGNNVRSNVSTILNGIFNVLGRLIGLFLIFLGCAFLFAYVTTLFGISVADSNSDITNWKSVIFGSSADYAMAVFSFIIVAGIPIFMLLFGGIKLLFKFKYNNRWLNLSLGITWILGVMIGIYTTVKTVKQFNEGSKVKETEVLHGMGDTLTIKLNPAMLTLKPYGYENADDLDTYFGRNNSGYQFGDLNKKLTIIGCAGLDVIESNSDSIELVINYEARGNNKREANENAKSIKYTYSQNNSELIFDEVFTVLAGTKFRAQEVNIKLKLPKGKVIYFDKSVKYLLDDIENTTNTWDGNMVGRRWKMTDRGLECIDCEGLEELDEEFNFNHRHHELNGKNITINEDGIKVNGTDAEIKIDENGIKIKTPKQPGEPKAPVEPEEIDTKGSKGNKGTKGNKGDKGEK